MNDPDPSSSEGGYADPERPFAGYADDLADDAEADRKRSSELAKASIIAETEYQRAYTKQIQAQTAYILAEQSMRETDKVARKIFMTVIGVVSVIQLAVTDIAFVDYAQRRSWALPTASISAFLGATMVQIVTVLLVVANNLFPRRDGMAPPKPLTEASIPPKPSSEPPGG